MWRRPKLTGTNLENYNRSDNVIFCTHYYLLLHSEESRNQLCIHLLTYHGQNNKHKHSEQLTILCPEKITKTCLSLCVNLPSPTSSSSLRGLGTEIMQQKWFSHCGRAKRIMMLKRSKMFLLPIENLACMPVLTLS